MSDNLKKIIYLNNNLKQLNELKKFIFNVYENIVKQINWWPENEEEIKKEKKTEISELRR